ncbi:MAG: glycosyltransferase [Dissulfurispiraceae bacterium]|jgi:dolichyl-phosphate beta-glucosyltransferase
MRELIPKKYAVFLKYAVVGCTGTAIDVGSLYLFVEFLHIHLLLATAMSFTLAVINNFALNKYWTFQYRSGNIRKQLIKFLIVSITGLVLTELSMALLVYNLKIWYMASKLITSGLVLMWNFLANKYWTFKDRIFHTPHTEKYSYNVSVVIPAYNEERRIGETLKAIHHYFYGKTVTRQIIVVNDGSSDNTAKVLDAFREEIPDLIVISDSPNHGKGYAVKKGVEASHGEYILFADADNATPIEEFEKFYPLLKDYKVVIGSRYISESNIVVGQPWYRVLIGRIGNMLIQFLLLDGVKDTQCGFKAFQHGAAREIFSRMRINGFGFDIEILSIARLLNFAVTEIPVSWYNSGESRVRPVKDALRTFRELIYIKLNLWGGKYY